MRAAFKGAPIALVREVKARVSGKPGDGTDAAPLPGTDRRLMPKLGMTRGEFLRKYDPMTKLVAGNL